MEVLKPDHTAIVAALKVFLDPGQVVEIRVLNVRTGRGNFTENQTGYFDTEHLEDLAREVCETGQASGFYWTLNPVLPALQARAFNRLKKAERGSSTGDHEILCRRWMLIDLDATRPAGISSTDKEKAASKVKAQQIRDYLQGHEWPSPVVVDSGNGFHLLYRIDLPADDSKLVERCLKALDGMFSDQVVKVDTTNSNASRITKLPGTPVRKGDSTPSRPHRLSKLIQVPQVLEVVPTALLEALAGPVVQKTKPPKTPAQKPPSDPFDLDGFMKRHFPGVSGRAWEGGTLYEIGCPFRETDGNAFSVQQHPNGAISAGCQHATCDGSRTTGNHWRELREKLEPPSDNNGGPYEDEDVPFFDEYGVQIQVIEPLRNTVTPTEKHKPLEVLRWHDLKDRPVPPVCWLWEPYFPKVPFGILGSHPGHGKSLLSLQIAVGTATGLPVFGIPTCGPAGAGVLALEDDKNVIHRRLEAIVKAYGSDWAQVHDDLMDQNLRVMVRGRTPLEGLDGTAAAHHLSALAQELGAAMQTTKDPPALLFLDTLNAVHGGDENSNTEVRVLAATVFGLHDALGCSVWALHHLRKSGNAKSAPSFTDRMDPELVRGAGAFVGSARAVVQFGWITSVEAGKAGLEATNSHRLYAVVGLTKINDGPLSPWLLLEHAQLAGLWTKTPGGDKALATIRGSAALDELTRSEKLLLDIHRGVPQATIAEKLYPGDPKGKDKVKGAIQDLRRRHGWLQPKSTELTVKGFEKIQELGRQGDEPAYSEGAEDENYQQSA